MLPVVGMQTGAVSTERSLKCPQKVEKSSAVQSSCKIHSGLYLQYSTLSYGVLFEFWLKYQLLECKIFCIHGIARDDVLPQLKCDNFKRSPQKLSATVWHILYLILLDSLPHSQWRIQFLTFIVDRLFFFNAKWKTQREYNVRNHDGDNSSAKLLV